MKHGFFNVVSPARFVEILRTFAPLKTETVALHRAHGRVLAQDIIARENLPLADRSCMDGFAVRARDLFGATEGNPGYLECVGDIAIDQPADFHIGPGQCAGITTGGCLPEGADTVVMIEHTQILGAGTVEFRKSAAPRDHVMLKGEDAAEGETMLTAGQRLRAQEIGLLAALGYPKVEVFRQPRAGILSTGDELVPVDQTPRPGQVRDVNSHALAALIADAGAEATPYGLVPDDLVALIRGIGIALEENDMVFLSGGSSIGMRDLTVQAIESFHGAEIMVHGVSVSPGKPTILAKINGKPVWGLPGQVTSAQVVMHVFGQPFLKHLAGDARAFDRSANPTRQAELARNVASKQGREDHVRVELRERDGQLPLAVPKLGKSGLLKTLVQAHGLVTIDESLEGLTAGTVVGVRLM